MRPNWLAANIVAGLQDLVAQLEAIAFGNALDATRAANFSTLVATGPQPSLSTPAPVARVGGVGNALVALYNAVPFCVSAVVDASVPAAAFAIARAIGRAMQPGAAIAAFAAAVDAIADPSAAVAQSANRTYDAANAGIVARLSRAVLMAPYAQALVDQVFADRPGGITARADLVERVERELALCFGAPDAAVALALVGLRDAGVKYLSQEIINLAPVVTVSAPQSLPSLWWAWRLYQDPARAADLIARNDVAHAAFMPERFEALAPA